MIYKRLKKRLEIVSEESGIFRQFGIETGMWADRGDLKKMRGAMMWFIAAAQYVGVGKPCVVYRLSKKCFKTTVAEISRLAASGITSDVGASITSSLTIMLRRTGRQCMKYALLVTAMCFESTVQLMSFDITLP